MDDWDRIDSTTGQYRAFQRKEALACIDFSQVAVTPNVPVVDDASIVHRERVIMNGASKRFACLRDSKTTTTERTQ